MSRERAIASALKSAGLPAKVRSIANLSGGCIHEVVRITLDDGSHVVAKINDASKAQLFEEEAFGLGALAATNTVLVPAPLGVTASEGLAVFLMEAIEPASATSEAWARFGRELAALHQTDAGSRYGFEMDNHLGTTPQPNTWCEDWVRFNAEHRLGHQLSLARRSGALKRGEIAAIERVIERLNDSIPAKPKPALLHGDLWSGNALPAIDREGNHRIAVIDPAPYIGDGWADIAMMRLFGGFARECFDAYEMSLGEDAAGGRADIDTRIAVYQLYHVLNHVNLFGRGYASQAMSLARSLSGRSAPHHA